jgi:hypothetical protein
LLASVLNASSAPAQFSLGQSQRASDGTVYEVVTVSNSTLLAGADQFRITAISGGVNGLGACTSSSAGTGLPTQAVAGADPNVPQSLHPFNEVLRTSVLIPNNFTVSFNPGGSGRLTIGTTTQLDICRCRFSRVWDPRFSRACPPLI